MEYVSGICLYDYYGAIYDIAIKEREFEDNNFIVKYKKKKKMYNLNLNRDTLLKNVIEIYSPFNEIELGKHIEDCEYIDFMCCINYLSGYWSGKYDREIRVTNKSNLIKKYIKKNKRSIKWQGQ